MKKDFPSPRSSPSTAALSIRSGFFGLQGLFAAHVTGNFVTIGSSRLRHARPHRQASRAAPIRRNGASSRAGRAFPHRPQKLVCVSLLTLTFSSSSAFSSLPMSTGRLDGNLPAALAASFTAVARNRRLECRSARPSERCAADHGHDQRYDTGPRSTRRLDAAHRARKESRRALTFHPHPSPAFLLFLGCAIAIVSHLFRFFRSDPLRS